MTDINPLNLPNLAPSGSSSALPFIHPTSTLEFTDAQVDEYREQDRWLPIANVARIMKNALPPAAKVSKEAKECVQECCSEFISFITSEAAEKCLNEKRKTINGEDILTSMRTLGFDNYEGVLKVYLAKYREHTNSQSKLKQALQADDLYDTTTNTDTAEKRGYEDDDDSVQGRGQGQKKKKGKPNGAGAGKIKRKNGTGTGTGTGNGNGTEEEGSA